MLGRYSEMDVDLTLVVGGILCSLLKMFFESGVNSPSSRFVELQQGFWQESVVKSVFLKHCLNNVDKFTLFNQLRDGSLVKPLTCLVKRLEESEMVDTVEIGFLKIGFRRRASRCGESKHVLKHAAGCSGGWNKFLDCDPSPL